MGIQLKTPKGVIETNKLPLLDLFKCPPIQPWCTGIAVRVGSLGSTTHSFRKGTRTLKFSISHKP